MSQDAELGQATSNYIQLKTPRIFYKLSSSAKTKVIVAQFFVIFVFSFLLFTTSIFSVNYTMSKSNQHKDRLKLQRNCDYDLSFEVKDEETQINEELNFDIEILDKLTEIEEKMIVDREMYRECTYDMLWRNECQMELVVHKNKTLKIHPPFVKPSSFLIVGVLSAADNFRQRKAIRETWFRYSGNFDAVFLVALPKCNDAEKEKVPENKIEIMGDIEGSNYNDSSSNSNKRRLEEIVFVNINKEDTGKSEKICAEYIKRVNDLMLNERIKYNDILLIDDFENYKGITSVLPYKTAAFIYFSSLLKVKWLFKTDDDAFLYPPGIFKVIRSLPQDAKVYGGAPMWIQPPERDPNSKWYVPLWMWDKEIFNPYVSGAGILLSIKSVRAMAKVVPTVQYLPSEDSYVGELAFQCGIQVTGLDVIKAWAPSSMPVSEIVGYKNDGTFTLRHYVKSTLGMNQLYRVLPDAQLENLNKLDEKVEMFLKSFFKHLKNDDIDSYHNILIFNGFDTLESLTYLTREDMSRIGIKAEHVDLLFKNIKNRIISTNLEY